MVDLYLPGLPYNPDQLFFIGAAQVRKLHENENIHTFNFLFCKARSVSLATNTIFTDPVALV